MIEKKYHSKKIVLIHGWGSRTDKLQPLAISLQQFGWKTLNLKLPGFELAPPNSVWGISEFANFVYEKTNKTFGEDDFFVFGHSFGGRISVKLAASGYKKILGVVLCASSGFSRPNLVKRFILNLTAKGGKTVLKILGIKSENLRRLFYKAVGEHDYEKTEGIMAEVFKKVISEDLKSLLEKVELPTLLIWGERDKVTPLKDGLFLKKMIKNSKLVTFATEGHTLPYQKPDQVALEIDKWYQTLFG